MSTQARTAREIERWFDGHGLPYFVGSHAEAVEGWVRSWRIVLGLVTIGVVAVGSGLAVGLLLDGGGWGTVTTAAVLLALLGLYAGRLLRLGTMLRWAIAHTFGSLGLLFPLLTRALPLLLLAVTFLFINAEVWQVAALMPRHVLWLAVGFFAVMATAFLLVRLPEEVRRVEAEVVADEVRRRCEGTPAEAAAGAGAATIAPVALPRFARVNLVIVLLFNQAIQVLLLAVALFGFFVVFGSLTIPDTTIEAWTQQQSVTDLPSSLGRHLPVTNELFQVAVFLASFSGLYFTVYAVTDETYRTQFFSAISDELETAVAVHAVYTSLPSIRSQDE